MKLLTPDLGLIFWMTVVFLLLLFILGKYGWPVILKMLKEREQRIKDALQAADKAKAEMMQQQEINKKILEEAKAERDAILKTARQAGDRIIKEVTQEAQTQAAKIIEEARRQMMDERQQAIRDMNKDMVEMSILLSEKILLRELADKEQAKIEIEKRIREMNLS